MNFETLIDSLAADLKPVRRRSTRRDALAIGAICLVELALFLVMGMARPDMPAEMMRMSLWWRLSNLGVITLCATGATILSFDPIHSPKRALRWVVGLVVCALAFGGAVGAGHHSAETIVQRLDWTDGVECVGKIVLLSIPPLIGLGLLMRRGAAIDAPRTAILIGLAASAWGAFVFVFACPFNDPLYIAFWYVIGGGIVTLASRLILPPLTRW
ncbi:MAG: hypothetical protein B7Z58_14845 [Acidiphilium sp. 37-64-53]|uniref:DUF1109 domain-containing protein n=1 Tax=Acidiphilium sp. 37-64-53 TaxID=1970299 RepID=UPI000BC3F298|nr:DUF1109 domain-containing protein [Acidiphilium sp. 37-64-53]OYW00599.1 MAG: hypothetical protein B7Z58_14845 [Acidiphilium sp. 37-64-53]HQT89529.1 DUF1109 domain-containing protein [Acidiphilium sp.]